MHPSQNILQCPNSCVVFFPKEVYQSVGSSDVLPQLLDLVEVQKLCAVQFLRNGAVRMTFKQTADCEEFIAGGLTYKDVPLRIASADARSRLVYLRDCPSEVTDDAVLQFFSSYGEVHSVKRSKHAAFPALHDGNRVVRMSLSKDIPSAVYVSGFDCRVWYARQPPQCSICNKSGHRNRDCPLSGLCRRCRQPGHRAKECKQAWGPTRSAVPVEECTEVLVSDSLSNRDDSPDFVPQDDDDDDGSVSVDECEMASGDEAVAAETASLPSTRRRSSKSAQAPASSVQTPAPRVPEPVQAPASCANVPVSEPPKAPTSRAKVPVSKPAQAPAPRVSEPARAPSSVAAQSSCVSKSKPDQSLIKQLKACAAKDPYLAEELRRRGRVVSEELLRRIPAEIPFGSVDYIHCLVDLIDEAIGFKDSNRPPIPGIRYRNSEK